MILLQLLTGLVGLKGYVDDALLQQRAVDKSTQTQAQVCSASVEQSSSWMSLSPQRPLVKKAAINRSLQFPDFPSFLNPTIRRLSEGHKSPIIYRTNKAAQLRMLKKQ